MESILDALQIVLSIFAMIAVGMLLTQLKWIGEKEASFLSRLVIRVALPATIVTNMFGKFTAESLVGMAAGLIAPVIGLLLGMAIGYLVAKLLKIERRRFGAFVVLFTFSNSIFIGLPVCRALFGEDAVPYTLIYYIANTSLFWTVGYSFMSRDGGRAKEERSYRTIPAYWLSKEKDDPRFIPTKNALRFLGKTIPLPLVFLIISSICVLLHITLPKFLMSAANYIGGCVTPLSLIYTGYILMRMIRNRNFRWEKGYLAICLGKFLLVPVANIVLISLLKLIPSMAELLNPTMVGALVIEASMPAMTQTTIVEGNVGGDDEYVAGATALTTALSMIFIPVYMYVVTNLL